MCSTLFRSDVLHFPSVCLSHSFCFVLVALVAQLFCSSFSSASFSSSCCIFCFVASRGPFFRALASCPDLLCSFVWGVVLAVARGCILESVFSRFLASPPGLLLSFCSVGRFGCGARLRSNVRFFRVFGLSWAPPCLSAVVLVVVPVCSVLASSPGLFCPSVWRSLWLWRALASSGVAIAPLDPPQELPLECRWAPAKASQQDFRH